MAATWRIREVFVTLLDSSFIATFSSELKNIAYWNEKEGKWVLTY